MPDQRGAGLTHDREVLIDVLTYHQRASSSHCACGWSKLGHSFADHIADVYEDSLRVRADV